MPTVAAVVIAAFTIWFLACDARVRPAVSPATWIVVAWFLLIGSRPISGWFDLAGFEGTAAQAYDEGNPLERSVYFVLIALCVGVLLKRGVRWRNVAGGNALLILFFAYWALSIFWADVPFVAFKRWIKDAGNIVIALVVLSDRNPLQALRTTLMRSCCILVAASVFLIRFVPALGRTYHVGTGEMMYTGVATHKNSLGVLAMVCLLFLLWNLLCGPPNEDARRHRVMAIAEMVMVAMAGWLVAMSGSATALSCAVVGSALIVLLAIRPVRASVWVFQVMALIAAGCVVLTDSAGELLDYLVVDLLGRDLTLTTRTDVWPTLLAKMDNVYFGAGFNSFWTGERLADIYGKLGIIQAHNGYLETYLNGGMAAAALLGLLLLGATVSVNNRLTRNDASANLAFALIVVSVIYNFTEASFDKTSPLWFVLLLTITSYRGDAQLTVRPTVERGAADQLPRQFGILPWS